MVVMRRFVTGSGSRLGQDDQGASTAPEVISQDGPALTEDRVREIIREEVVEIVRSQIPELFSSIKTTMMEYFGDKYTTLAKTVVATAIMATTAEGGGSGRGFQYRDFDNTKPPTFDGIQDPIIAMRWLSDIKRCFFTCSYPTDQKVRCALNMLRYEAKDWWRLMTGSYSDERRPAISWDQFREMFRSHYIT